MNVDPSGYFTLAEVNVSGAINNILDNSATLNYMRIYQNLKSKLNAINNILTLYDTARQIAMIINDPELSGWQMVEGIACGVITGLFMNRMCQMKAIGPIISKVLTGYGLATQWQSIMDAAKNKDWDLVGTRSIQLILSLMSLHQNCFTGETLVATENGQIRIDEIEVGDKVWAYDIFTGETALKEVTKVYVHEVDEILHLHTSCGDIDTTTNHPFFVIDRGWVAAGDLVVGDEVYLLDGSTAVIIGFELEQLSETIKVYNLEVADFNTYFVGDEAVLVHNYLDKSDHAKHRQAEGRNVGTAGHDLNNARPSDVYIQNNDGRYVLKGNNGRVHIFEPDGELVTTMNKVTNFSKRVSSGRYSPLSLKQISEFIEIFGEFLNKNWNGYR